MALAEAIAMPKLHTLKPEGWRSRYRENYAPWRAWYRTKAWYDLRTHVFVRDLFTCQWQGCGRLEGNTKLLVAHHKRPHHGDSVLFWDETNIITVCKQCHDGPIQAMEKGAGYTGPSFSSAVSRDGWPIDPKHPANR